MKNNNFSLNDDVIKKKTVFFCWNFCEISHCKLKKLFELS